MRRKAFLYYGVIFYVLYLCIMLLTIHNLKMDRQNSLDVAFSHSDSDKFYLLQKHDTIEQDHCIYRHNHIPEFKRLSEDVYFLSAYHDSRLTGQTFIRVLALLKHKYEYDPLARSKPRPLYCMTMGLNRFYF